MFSRSRVLNIFMLMDTIKENLGHTMNYIGKQQNIQYESSSLLSTFGQLRVLILHK